MVNLLVITIHIVIHLHQSDSSIFKYYNFPSDISNFDLHPNCFSHILQHIQQFPILNGKA